MKRLWFLLLLVMAVEVRADVLDSTAQYYLKVRQNLGLATTNTTTLPNAEIEDYLDEAVLTICQGMKIIRADKTALTTVRVSTYAFTAFDSLAIGVITVLMQKADSLKTLIYRPREQWFSSSQTDEEKLAGSGTLWARWPLYYDYSTTHIFLYPPPGASNDTIKVGAILKPPGLASNTLLTTIPTQFRHLVLTYTTWLAAAAKQNPMLPVIFTRLQLELSALGWKLDASGALMPLGR